MVEAGLAPLQEDLHETDKIPLTRRTENFLENGWATIVIRSDEEKKVIEALSQDLDYDPEKGWYKGDKTAKAHDLSKEIDGLDVGEQTQDFRGGGLPDYLYGSIVSTGS